MKSRFLAAFTGGLVALLCLTPVLATQTTITSQAQLRRYLHDTPRGSSPLDKLSPGGRKRFLAQLKFGRNGLGGFSTDDLVNELTHAQIVQIMALFDSQQYANGLGLSPAQRTQRQRERVAAARFRGCADVATCPESDIEQRYDQLVLYKPEVTLPEARRAALITRRYDHLFSQVQSAQRVRRVSAPDLRLLGRAAEYAVVHATDPAHVAQLQRDLGEMQRRGMADDSDFEGLYAALIGSRRFKEASDLKQRHPAMDVAAAPVLTKHAHPPPGQPTALTLAAHGQSMTRQAFDMSVPLRIVVVASCHFSQDAARAIHADAQLRPLFERHALWLADQNEAFASVRDWNSRFPQQPIHVAWRNSDWSMLDSWVMPTFYVFRHGRLIDQWAGWPADSGLQTLRAHLRNDGVLQDTPG